MNAPAVDVLATLRHADDTLVSTGVPHLHALAAELDEARAAVAELLAADKEFDHAQARRIEADNRITLGDRSDEAFRKQASAHHSHDRAKARRAEALARVGGDA